MGVVTGVYTENVSAALFTIVSDYLFDNIKTLRFISDSPLGRYSQCVPNFLNINNLPSMHVFLLLALSSSSLPS